MKYFTLAELCISKTGIKLGINNTPTAEAKRHLEDLVDKILDPLREAYGKPIHVNSGYRCEDLNKAVGGSARSHHLYGKAADITAISSSREQRKAMNREIFELCQSLDLPYTQLINEYDYTWIHVSYDPKSVKHEIKTIN